MGEGRLEERIFVIPWGRGDHSRCSATELDGNKVSDPASSRSQEHHYNLFVNDT